MSIPGSDFAATQMTGAPSMGHNNPPEETPFEAVSAKILDLYDKAGKLCDGEPIGSEKQATEVSTLISDLRIAAKEAETLRKKEAKPHDDAKKAIQARYNPLIQKDKGKTELAIEMLKGAMVPWLEKKQRAKEEAEQRAREEAEAERLKAEQAMAAAQASSSLKEREEAERLADNAELAEHAAKMVGKQSTTVKNGNARGTYLKSIYTPTITDRAAVCAHYWNTNQDALMSKIMELVRSDFSAGNRNIPGVQCNETKTAI